MRLLTKSIAALVILGLGFVLAKAVTNDQISSFFAAAWPYFAGVGALAIILAGAMVIGAVWGLNHLIRRSLGVAADMEPDEMVSALADHFLFNGADVETATSAEKQRAAAVNIGVWMFRRQVIQFYFGIALAIGGGLVGAATVFLLIEQNQKLEHQNSKLALQTDASVAQSLLLEGTRRAALSNGFGILLQSISNEPFPSDDMLCRGIAHSCWMLGTDESRSHTRILSENLEVNVIASAQQSTPYHIVDVPGAGEVDFNQRLGEQIDLLFLSPERGQLIQALVKAKARIPIGNYSNADLYGAQLPSIQMMGSDLSNSRLAGADLRHADLRNANIRGADLRGAIITEARLTGTDLSGADLRGAGIIAADLRGANVTAILIDDFFVYDFRGAVALADMPPVGLRTGSQVTLCKSISRIYGSVPAVAADRQETTVEPVPYRVGPGGDWTVSAQVDPIFHFGGIDCEVVVTK